MNRLIKRILVLVLALSMCLSVASPIFADGIARELTIHRQKSGDTLTITIDGQAKSLYFVFNLTPKEYKVNGKTIENYEFLQQYIELDSPSSTVVIEGADPHSIYAFDGTNTPDWVHKWEAPCEKADLLLISSHADDEQLFFAGILPYYAQVRKMQVQVVYATDHDNQIVRHQERLNGLWAVGIRNYPLSSGFADLYSESYDEALRNLATYGTTEEDIMNWEKAMIERFKPQVIVTHDINGEYGHGMHILVNGTLRKVLANAASDYPFLQKVYFHLYEEEPITLEVIDEAYDELDGMTPFQVTQQKGFACHESQHWTWFKRWIWGSKEAITISKASEIKTYSPLYYGCYYRAVDADVEKNDFFEHLLSYEEIAVEEARIAAEKAEAERLAAETEQRELEVQQAAKKKQQTIITIGIGAVILFVIAAIVLKVIAKPRRKSKH